MTPDEFFEQHKQYIRDTFTKTHTFPPMGAVLGTMGPDGETIPPSPIPIFVNRLENDGEKEAFATAIRSIVTRTKATAVLCCFEAWAMFESTEAQYEEYKRRQMRGESLEGMPGRSEVVYMVAETASSVNGWYAAIDRTGATPQLGEWQSFPLTATHSGRFAGLLIPHTTIEA